MAGGSPEAVATAVALAVADLALAGIRSPIPADEVIDVMGQLGRGLPVELSETGLGGLAAIPTGMCLARKVSAKGWRRVKSGRRLAARDIVRHREA